MRSTARFLFLVLLLVVAGQAAALSYKAKLCESCLDLADRIRERMAATDKFQHMIEIGHRIDGKGERKGRKVPYATSETRLVEVLDNICVKHHNKHEIACSEILDEHDESISGWYFEEPSSDAKTAICYQRAQLCNDVIVKEINDYNDRLVPTPEPAAPSPLVDTGLADSDSDIRRDPESDAGADSGNSHANANAVNAEQIIIGNNIDTDKEAAGATRKSSENNGQANYYKLAVDILSTPGGSTLIAVGLFIFFYALLSSPAPAPGSGSDSDASFAKSSADAPITGEANEGSQTTSNAHAKDHHSGLGAKKRK